MLSARPLKHGMMSAWIICCGISFKVELSRGEQLTIAVSGWGSPNGEGES